MVRLQYPQARRKPYIKKVPISLASLNKNFNFTYQIPSTKRCSITKHMRLMVIFLKPT